MNEGLPSGESADISRGQSPPAAGAMRSKQMPAGEGVTSGLRDKRGFRAGGWARTFSSLRNRGFRHLWIGTMFMWCAGSFQSVVQGYLAYDLTGSAGVLGVISLGYGLPLLGLALFGGAVADRVERKRLIQLFQAAEAVIALALAVSVMTDTITWYHILVASVIHGALFAFMLPARQAIIPRLVDRSQITNAMALNNAGMGATGLAAPAIAGFLYASLGAETVFLAMFGLQLVAAILIGLVPATGGGAARRKSALLIDVRDGLLHIRDNRMVLVLLFMALASTLLAMPLRLLLPVFVVEIYQREADAMGLLVAIAGAGSLGGALFLARLGDWRRGPHLIAASFLIGIALLLMSAFPHYLAAVAAMLLFGLGSALNRTLIDSLAMDSVEDRFRGRVMSVLMMSIGLVPLGVLPLGLVADFWGARSALAIMAGLTLAAASLVAVTQKRLREAQ